MNTFSENYFNKKNNELFNMIQENMNRILSESGSDFSNSPHFDTIEMALKQIKEKNNVHMNLMKIQKAINAEFKTNCIKVFITENNVKSYFFGAHVIPTEKECYKLSSNLIKLNQNVKFEVCSEFVIELDSKLIYDLDATPEEITAVLLHEIGHKVFHTENKVKMKETLISTVLSAGLSLATAVLFNLAMLQFILFTLILSYFSSSFSNARSIKDEINADSFAVKAGYAVHLNSVINKIIENSRAFGNFGYARNKEKEDKAVAQWCFKSIIDFKLRKQFIRKDLESMLKSEQNPEVRKIINSQISMLDKMSKRTKGLNNVNMNIFSTNTTDSMSLKPVTESFSSFTEMNSKGLSYLELDELEVEIDRIRDHEDKLYVISRIHKNLADNGKFIKEKEKQLSKKRLSDEEIRDNVEMKELIAYRKQLMDLLQKCRRANVREKHHHFIVGYPMGYEG